MNGWFKNGAATLTAVVVVIGGLGALVWFVGTGIIPSDVGVPAIVGTIAAATTYLWMKQAAKDAANTALAQPGDVVED